MAESRWQVCIVGVAAHDGNEVTGRVGSSPNAFQPTFGHLVPLIPTPILLGGRQEHNREPEALETPFENQTPRREGRSTRVTLTQQLAVIHRASQEANLGGQSCTIITCGERLCAANRGLSIHNERGPAQMRFVALIFTAFAIAFSAPANPAAASIYDNDVVAELNLQGAQRAQMQKLMSQSRSRRNAIFREFGIDPNAKPDMAKLQKAQTKLRANRAREKAQARKILSVEQYRAYERTLLVTQNRIINALN